MNRLAGKAADYGDIIAPKNTVPSHKVKAECTVTVLPVEATCGTLHNFKFETRAKHRCDPATARPVSATFAMKV